MKMRSERRKTKNKAWKNKIINIFIILLFIAGLVLVFNKPIRNFFISKNINHYQVNKVSREAIKDNEKAKASFDFDGVKPISSERIASSQLNAQYMD